MSRAKNQPTTPEAIPLLLRTKPFFEAWAEFIQHRKESRKALTPTAARLQLKRLEAMGVDRAIAAIRNSVANGWTGIFEPKDQQTQQRSGSARYDGGW